MYSFYSLPATAFTLLFTFSSFFAAAQCSDMRLGTLQSIQKADDIQKEVLILDAGFDLLKEWVSKGSTVKQYSKCWMGTKGDQEAYEQVILWNQGANTINFLVYGQVQYKQLKSSITDRGNASQTSGNGNLYVGHMFRYYFGEQSLDGTDYYSVTISLK